MANVTYGSITFSNVCQTKNESCMVWSVTQYYQNDAATLSREVFDEYHFYVEGDYLDHFLMCAK